jgi:tRNA threonylcarbamoyladenosine biosynthesis protein TsaE
LKPRRALIALVSNSPEETEAAGEKAAGFLRSGSVAAINGALGAGKTCLVRGIARKLGVEDEITSPTYTIVHEHEARAAGIPLTFYHLDAYRLRGADDFYGIGGEEIISSGGVVVIEWAERVIEALPPDALEITISIEADGGRRVTVTGGAV